MYVWLSSLLCLSVTLRMDILFWWIVPTRNGKNSTPPMYSTSRAQGSHCGSVSPFLVVRWSAGGITARWLVWISGRHRVRAGSVRTYNSTPCMCTLDRRVVSQRSGYEFWPSGLVFFFTRATDHPDVGGRGAVCCGQKRCSLAVRATFFTDQQQRVSLFSWFSKILLKAHWFNHQSINQSVYRSVSHILSYPIHIHIHPLSEARRSLYVS